MHIIVKGDITLEGNNNANKRNKNLAFKNNAPFINCISKINGVKIDNAEDLDVVMPMYNLLEYSKNYKKTTGSSSYYFVTLSKENDTKLLEQLKSGSKRTIKWNKYRSQMAIQPQNNDLNYLLDRTFTNVNRLFVLSFQRIAGENNTTKDYRYYFSHYFIANIKIKDFNVLIDGKIFFDLPVKNKEEAYEKIIDMSNNNDCTTGNLLHFASFKQNYKLIAIDLSKQIKRPTTN